MDPTTTSILALLKQRSQTLGVTVQMSVIEEICSRVAILDGASVAEQGSVQDIFSNPFTDAARRLVYPNGVHTDHIPSSFRTVRISFNGGTVYHQSIFPY